MKNTYQKIRFTSERNGVTAGLIIESEKLATKSLADISRLFPISEATKMAKLEVSPSFDSWEQAFFFAFPRS